ncbi:MAG: hypothetical protein NTW25_10365 [Candidatus Kapabacteria bacterium]|nr:hypothetical protein [Candidatus Kapabacteria bacterium]
MRRYAILSAVLLSILLTSCSVRIGDFTIVSTKNYEKNTKYKMVGRFTGDDIRFFAQSNLKSAADACIQKAPGGVYLTNAVISIYSGFFTAGYEVTGDVWAPAETSDLLNSNIDSYTLVVKNGEKFMKNNNEVIEVLK